MRQWGHILLLLCACTAQRMGLRGDGMLTQLTVSELETRRAQFVDVVIAPDAGAISEEDWKVLKPIIRAARVMDRLFWRQASEIGLSVLAGLQARQDERAKLLRELVEIHYGPYDRLRGDEPFLDVAPKPLGATFYPPDMTREEFEAHLAAHPEDREAFESPFTVIRRDSSGGLRAIPYSEFYREDLAEASAWLRQAASLTRDALLARFLEARAKAFETNDYFESDIYWMDIGQGEASSAIEVTIGPYEVYEDRLMNLKAAFEAFVCIRDRAESDKLAKISEFLDEIEASLPVDDRHKNYSRGSASPISVVQVVMTAGDTRAGVQTTAFNLPNDERVRAAKGSKKVLLKNVGKAKFEMSLLPIAREVLESGLLPFVTFEAYFNHVLMHEVSHGLGPGIITMPDGSKTTVNAALRENYSAVEECKADILGLFSTKWLAEKGVLPAQLLEQTMATYLAGVFRSVRFGFEQAHGKASLVAFNFLRRAGAITYEKQRGRFGVDRERFWLAVTELAKVLLTIEAEGNYEEARKFLLEMGQVSNEMAQALSRLGHVPVDIRPIYPLEEQAFKD